MAQGTSTSHEWPSRAVFYAVGGFELVAAGWSLSSGHWLEAFSYSVVALVVAMTPSTQRRHEHLGWLHGRSAMTKSMIEAAHRGMSLKEFLTAELERDMRISPLPEQRHRWRRNGRVT